MMGQRLQRRRDDVREDEQVEWRKQEGFNAENKKQNNWSPKTTMRHPKTPRKTRAEGSCPSSHPQTLLRFLLMRKGEALRRKTKRPLLPDPCPVRRRTLRALKSSQCSFESTVID